MQQQLKPMVVAKPEVAGGKPVIAGTSVTVEAILFQLAAGVRPEKIVTAYALKDDTLLDVIVEYAESLPSDSHLAHLLQQYRQQQRQKVNRILERFKQYCQQQYGQRLVKLVLFGSQARGDFKPSSDIDVLVVLEAPLDWNRNSQLVTEFIADVSIETGELISCIFMDSDRFQNAREFLLAAIRHDEITL